MGRYDAGKERFEEITVFEKPALFICIRIDRSTVPDGMFLYEVRHSDEDFGEPVQIAEGILVNHFGTILTCEPIDLPADRCLDIEKEDWAYSDGAVRRSGSSRKSIGAMKVR